MISENHLSLTRGFYELILREIRVLVKAPWVVCSRGLFFLIQIFVFAVLMDRVVDAPNFDFFAYYSIGTILVTISSIAFLIGHDVYEEAETGLLDYLLTLPFSRRVYILGRCVGGAFRSMIYVTPMFGLVAVIRGFTGAVELLGALALLFVLAFGITGLSITVAVTIRNQNRFDITLALLELFMIRFSTALYPPVFMPSAVATVSVFSPVTLTSDAVRAVLQGGEASFLGVGGLIAFVIVFFAASTAFYFKRIEGGYFH
ncbi:MAG: hypothetical protein CMO12_02160 [Thaumarchaeota archaeon]|nr:hypothetical protein [Nitrososphaerota archaeon]